MERTIRTNHPGSSSSTEKDTGLTSIASGSCGTGPALASDPLVIDSILFIQSVGERFKNQWCAVTTRVWIDPMLPMLTKLEADWDSGDGDGMTFSTPGHSRGGVVSLGGIPMQWSGDTLLEGRLRGSAVRSAIRTARSSTNLYEGPGWQNLSSDEWSGVLSTTDSSEVVVRIY